MKKTIFAFLLAILILFSACEQLPVGPNTPDTPENPGTTDTPRDPNADVVDNPTGDCSIAHTDKNDDGQCDRCSVTVVYFVDFYALNDLHGKFDDIDDQPGVDELTTYLKDAYATEDNVVILSSGDMWQGSVESGLTKGNIMTDWMNELDFAAMTLGNHEFDWGQDVIQRNAEIAEFPFLAINIYDKATDKPVDYCQPSVLVDRGDVQIGIIGAIGNCLSSISGDYSKDIYFKTGNSLTALVKAESEKLRSQGADIIVYSIHDGRESSANGAISDGELKLYYDVSLSDGYVDLVFEGHTHRSYTYPDSKGVYHLQNGGENQGISHAEIKVNLANGNTSTTVKEFVPASKYTSLDDDPVVDQLLEKYADKIPSKEPLGKNDFTREGGVICDIIAELYCEAGIEKWGDKYDIVLGGGYLKTRSPYRLPAGQVTYSQLYSILTFDNQLVLCSIRGDNLLSKFINTPNGDYHIGYSEYGYSVKDNIDPKATYYIVVDSYTSTYAPNKLTEIERYDPDTYARDLLAKHIQNGGLTTPIEIPESFTPLSEIQQIGKALPDNAETEELYYVQGKVVQIQNLTYGNMWIEDENGDKLWIYGLYNIEGARYDDMPNRPIVGDTVTLRGHILKYVNADGVTVEMKNATLLELK